MFVGFVAAIVAGGGSAKADCIWIPKADMSTTRYGLSTSVVDGKIYAIGGLGNLRRVDEYDPQMNTWTEKADMPTGREFVSSSVMNGKIYVIGGKSGQPVSAVEVYDPATDTWAERTELPTRRMWLSTSVIDEIIYVIGGTDPSGGWPHLRTVEAYDPATDTWTPKAHMLTGRSLLSTCVMDGKIYAVGGWTPGATADVEAYDPVTDTWTRKAPMPTARYLLGTSVVSGKIYAIGGWQHSVSGPLYSTVEVYDPQTDTWTKEGDIPLPTAGLSTSVVDGNIYVIGGALTTHNGIFVHTSAVYVSDIIVDFNGDGIVDSADMCIMVDHWGDEHSLCDIAPPFGDGIVDVEDLKVLAEHLFEPVDDPTLVAHWALDETEGMVVADSAGDSHGYAVGDPLWQPDSGQVNGALEFDGVDDFISAPPPLNPADGPFSVLVWIKGGLPGQAIVSDTGGTVWLSLDLPAGHLMTELTSGGRGASFLLSQTAIDDGDWHRIGLVWDGLRRILYVDDAVVAEDTQGDLQSQRNGLYIGCDNPMLPGTFFSGLIDDIRIYSRAVRP
jgi:N-acetylneuraminic acid mutarotase